MTTRPAVASRLPHRSSGGAGNLRSGSEAAGAGLSVGEAARLGAQALARAGIEEAGLEAEVLLRHVLQVDRAHLYLAWATRLPSGAGSAFSALLERRLTREPLAYVIGHREFYGIDLCVDRRVLIPRPETELLVDSVLEWANHRREPCRIADIAAGSGAIAIALALSLPEAVMLATDISEEALDVAETNCRRHGVEHRVHLFQGDLLAPLDGPVDLIVANLPYVKTADMRDIAPDIRFFEPALALDGGEEGLDMIMRLLLSAPAVLRSGGALFLEIGQGQGEAAMELAIRAFQDAVVSLAPDLAGIMRVLRIETKDT